MRTHAALTLLALLLAACAPVYVTAPAGGGDVLPVEAQRVIDRATATAGVMATQIAGTTATAGVSAATSTAAKLATLDSLEVEQTQDAMGATAAARAVAATVTVAVFTQDARSTAQAATPTAAARQTQVVRDLAEFDRREAASANFTEFWTFLRWTMLAVVVVLGVVACVVLVVWGRMRIRTEEMRSKATIAQAAFRVLSSGHWAEWKEDGGYQVYSLGAPAAADEAEVVENVPHRPDRDAAWRTTFRRFAWAGHCYGFSMRKLAGKNSPYRVVTEPTWRQLTAIFRDAGVLAGSNDGTKWGDGWDYRRFADEFGQLRLALPHPDADPPAVGVGTVLHTTTPATPHHIPIEVVESVRR